MKPVKSLVWACALAETVLKAIYEQDHIVHFYLYVHDVKRITLFSLFE
jgi:hypothetical protein